VTVCVGLRLIKRFLQSFKNIRENKRAVNIYYEPFVGSEVLSISLLEGNQELTLALAEFFYYSTAVV
jgi:hypothetical protein